MSFRTEVVALYALETLTDDLALVAPYVFVSACCLSREFYELADGSRFLDLLLLPLRCDYDSFCTAATSVLLCFARGPVYWSCLDTLRLKPLVRADEVELGMMIADSSGFLDPLTFE